MFDFLCKAAGGELTTSDETRESRWVTKEQALDRITLLAIRKRYEAYLNFNGFVTYMEYVTATSSSCEVKVQRMI